MAIIIYARKSIENEFSVSCETQIAHCRAMLKYEDQGEEVISIVDNGFSGGSLNRDGFQKMMRMVQDGKVSKVIVYKVDRFSRSVADFANSMQIFKRHHVSFVSAQESIDTSSSYSEFIMQLLMVFAQFERTSIIDRITQAYAYRSDLGFYMGGNQPFGFELVPTVIHNIRTKKYNQIPSEAELVRYIFEVYAQEHVSLRRLQALLAAEGKNDNNWTTSKLSALLKNPIYVKADCDVYDYYDRRGVRMVNELSLFSGTCGAQLYGRSKHDPNLPDWSDMKLVLLPHEGIVDSKTWLKCQRKLEKNQQIRNSYSNSTSWLAGKVICEKCGYTMTTIKGKPKQNGEIRRYFNCTGKSHKRCCTGPRVTIYAEDLENLVYDCISEKLADLKDFKKTSQRNNSDAVNDLKLKIKAVEKSEKQLMDSMFSDAFNSDLLALANQKASQLKRDRLALNERMEELKNLESETSTAIDLAKSWKKANYDCKKSVVGIMVHQILIREDGSAQVIWNI